MLNMFRTLIYLSSGACNYSDELPHRSYCSWFDVCWSFGVVGLEWCPCCRLKHSRKLLMMDILMSETCWTHKKWNKIASDIKLVFCFQLLDLFSQRAWRWPDKGRNMSPWQHIIFIVYKIKRCVIDWHVVFIKANNVLLLLRGLQLDANFENLTSTVYIKASSFRAFL